MSNRACLATVLILSHSDVVVVNIAGVLKLTKYVRESVQRNFKNKCNLNIHLLLVRHRVSFGKDNNQRVSKIFRSSALL